MSISRPKDEQPFDRWLQRSLRDRYRAALREPLPQALQDMLRDDEA